MKMKITIATLLLAFSSLGAALAGPPLICRPVAIEGARSLPWADGPNWNGMLASYNTSHLVDDTLALLGPSTPAEVRMETMRRAAIYASRDPGAGQTLLMRLVARTRGAAIPETALFDAGYFAEALREAAQAYVMIHDPAQQAEWKLRSAPAIVIMPRESSVRH